MAVGICGEDKFLRRPTSCNWLLDSGIFSGETMKDFHSSLRAYVKIIGEDDHSDSANTPNILSIIHNLISSSLSPHSLLHFACI